MLEFYLFTTQLTWNVASSEKHTWWRKSGDMSILSSISTVKSVRATWSLCFNARITWILYVLRSSLSCSTPCMLIVEFVCNCKLGARIDLRRLHWNASLMRLTFSPEVCVFPDFTCIRLLLVLTLLPQTWMLFRIGGWHPYCVLKWRGTAVRDCNSACHNMHWTCCCGVDIVTELTKGHQLAHVHKPGMKRNFQSFPFWRQPDSVWQFPRSGHPI
jgi:hypothetical protein